jgi:hypothetical protein
LRLTRPQRLPQIPPLLAAPMLAPEIALKMAQ